MWWEYILLFMVMLLWPCFPPFFPEIDTLCYFLWLFLFLGVENVFIFHRIQWNWASSVKEYRLSCSIRSIFFIMAMNNVFFDVYLSSWWNCVDEFEFGTENMLSLKRFTRQKVKRLGLEAQVLKEKNIMKTISFWACMPKLLCTCFDQSYVGILLSTCLACLACLACPLSSILHVPLDESSARFFATSLVMALEDMHKV